MNTYYTTRDFEFLRNRPVVLESEALAEIEKLQAKLERAALSESADVSREIDYGNKIASLEPASGAFSAWRMDESRDVRAAWELGERVVWGAGKGAVA